MNLSLILAMEFPKKKKIVEVPRIKNVKYDRDFQLTTYFINTLFLFIINKQVKTEVRKQPLK